MAQTKQSSETVDEAGDAMGPSPEAVNEVIHWHAGYGAVGGIIPVPFLDIAVATTVQMRMIGKLCDLYDVPFTSQAVKSTVSSLVASVLPRSVLGYAAASTMRVVPFVGPILGALTFPALYGAVTWALGRTFAWHFARGGTLENVVSDETKERFRSNVESAKARFSKGKPADGGASPAASSPG